MRASRENYTKALTSTFDTSKRIVYTFSMRGSREPIPELHHRHSPAPHSTKATPQESPKHRYCHILQ
jgi:hypothetical protein